MNLSINISHKKKKRVEKYTMNIKVFLFKFLFPDYYRHYNLLKQNELNSTVKYKDMYSEVFERIQEDKVEVLGIEKNKRDEWVIVTKKETNSDLWIKLYSPTYFAANRHPRIMSSFQNSYYPEKKYIRIEDVLMEDDNIGNGSICMKYFIREAKKLDYDYIKGYLSSVDSGHFDRSIHFYEKFNFDVKMNDNTSSGCIRLDIKK